MASPDPDRHRHLLPAGEILRNLTIDALPEGWTPVDALCLIKC